MAELFDIVVIGGGASGLISAGTAAQQSGAKVLLLEKMEKLGRKIRITGKGRCNFTNDKPRADFLEKIRAGSLFFEPSFDALSNNDTMTFFENNGMRVALRQGGRAYPASDDAWDVVRALEQFCKKNGVTIACNTEVVSLKKQEDNFELTIKSTNGRSKLLSKNVIVATGGMSYPRTGSTGDGYRFARELGHKIEPLHPSLLPFNVDSSFLSRLKGLLLKNISLSLVVNGDVIKSEFGELEFFSFGVGGATVFRISRDAVLALDSGAKVSFMLDFKPALSVAKLIGRFEREQQALPGLNLEALLCKLLPRAVVPMILAEIGFQKTMLISKMSIDDKNRVIKAIKTYKLTVISHRGFDEAVITAGGVSLSEVNPLTMESLLCKGLYFVGEILDIDADTGGYNLQVAFSTGYLCGKIIFKR